MNFTTDVVVGLEIHAQLNTKSKLFCGCPTKGSDLPNTRVCEICLGHPGARPMLNKRVLDSAIKLCKALGFTIAKELIFSRKSYFYPDMSKNFQTTQFEEPLGLAGSLKLKSGHEIKINRAHIEEDPASITYPQSMQASSFSYIDYNRSGNPLLEIVTEPVLTSPAQAREFLNQLTSVLTYLKIFDADGIIKADANVSVKESGYTRVEIKNITGFKEIERALNYEIMRQRALLRRGLKVKLETRGWTGKATIPMRTKETEADYGYIIEPDLSIIDVTDEMVLLLEKEIPELAFQKSQRFVAQYQLDADDADVMSMELELAELFEKVAAKIDPKLAAKWLRRELLRVLNYNKKSLSDIAIDEKHLIELLALVEMKTISDTTAQRLMEMLIEGPFDIRAYVKKNNLEQVSDEGELLEICKKVVAQNQKAVDDYKSGSEKSFHYLVGQVMRVTKGKASPQVVHSVMKKVL